MWYLDEMIVNLYPFELLCKWQLCLKTKFMSFIRAIVGEIKSVEKHEIIITLLGKTQAWFLC